MPTSPSTDAIFDIPSAAARLNDDLDLLRKLGSMFLTSWPDGQARLTRALAASDLVTLHREAHTFHSLLATFSAQRARPKARALEQIAKDGRIEAAPAALDELLREIEVFIPVLTAFVDGENG